MDFSVTMILLAVVVCSFLISSWLSKRPLKTAEKKKDGKLLYRSLSPEDGWTLLQPGKKTLLLDVRTPDEYAYSHLPDSKNLPLNTLKQNAIQALGNRNKTILIYCQSSTRSKQATKLLYALGFTNVYDIGSMETFYKHRPM